MLTDAQISQYRADGYVIPDQFSFSDDELGDLRERQARLIARHPEFKDFCANLLAYDLTFLNYARHPTILEMVGQAIGPDFALWNSSLFSKPANGGLRTPWHQDGEFWPIRPLATCTVWIAIDDATPENGCLRVIPGSHKERRLRAHSAYDGDDATLDHELDPAEFDETQAVDMALRAGQVSLHDVYILHGSDANHSTRPRRGMTLRFMPTTSLFDRYEAVRLHDEMGIIDHSDRTLYLFGGRDIHGGNDFRMRR